MSTVEWRIPPSTQHWIEEVPSSAAVAVLLRHSVRGHLPHGDAGWAVPITSEGLRIAQQLGAMLGGRLQTLHTSPLPRCIQTAEALRVGAAVEIPVVPDRLLGDPGVYVVDGKVALSNWQSLGHEGVMEHLVSHDCPLPGMAAPGSAARFLVQHMLAAAGDRPGIHVFVTHDSLVTATAARILGQPLGTEAWPWYLEGAFFWRADGCLQTAYRDHCRQHERTDLNSLDEIDVIEFARREVARIVGASCDARFFLAGGAFKALLTGQPPRDLDLWAPSARDRALLLQALDGRGAHRLPVRPYADAFQIGEREVEVPFKTEPVTLEERLALFDIALSAVGVEHLPGDGWRAIVHPLARESVKRREVLLLKPLVNWKYALATLERMRRYAAELGYQVPADEEAEAWQEFESQSAEMQAGMLERFDRTAHGGYRVREEALHRLQ